MEMSTVKVQWLASENLIKAELAAAGESGPSKRTTTFDLKTMTQEQRVALLQLASVGANGYPGDLDITQGVAVMSEGKTAYCPRIANEYIGWCNAPIQLDAEPDVDKVIEMARAIEAQLRVERKTYAVEKAQKDAKDAEEKRVKAEKRAARVTCYKFILPALLETIRWKLPKPLEAFQVPSELWGFEPSSQELSGGNPYSAEKSLADLRDSALKELRAGLAETAKSDWIKMHGSAHLKRAFGRGYDCLRRYVVERVAVEAPGFTVDFDSKSDWKSRPCPSVLALDAEDEAAPIAEALKLALPPVVVWLTSSAQDTVPASEEHSDYDEEDFEPCEAVVLRSYLGKYDLVKVV